MARPAQQSVVDAVEAIRQCGVAETPEVELIEDMMLAVRGRARGPDISGSREQQRQGLTRCLRPIWMFISNQEALRRLNQEVQQDLIWNLFAASVARTAGAEAFPLFTGDVAAWQDVVTEMCNAEAFAPQLVQVHRGSNNWSLRIGIVGLVLLALEGWLPDGRSRFYASVVGLVAIVFAGLLWYFNVGQTVDPVRSTLRNDPVDTGLCRVGDVDAVSHSGGANVATSNTQQQLTASAPPVTAPPLPTSVSLAPGGESVASQSVQVLQTGMRVQLSGMHPYTSLGGQSGTITGFSAKGYALRLDSGLEIDGVQQTAMSPDQAGQTIVSDATATQNYAPFVPNTQTAKTQAQAQRLREALQKSSALQATTPDWPTLYWQAVKNEVELFGLDDEVKRVLMAHGYHGVGTIGAPRTDELKKALAELEQRGVPQHGAGGSLLSPLGDVNASMTDPENMSWHLRLPPDLQRAAPELYRNIRAEGVASVRQWVNDQHPAMEQRQGAAYQDLFTAATIIDYELAGCQNESSLMHRLATSDTLEIQLRKLGSFIYLRRTKEKAGALRMLGIRAPGTMTDIAPKWMLDDANSFSKVEWQRTERGNKQSRSEPGSGHSGGGGGRYAGKFRGRGRGGGGKGGGKGRGGAAPSTQG